VVPWSAELVAAVRDALPDRYTELVDCGAGLGMRQGEVFGLSVDDVDFLQAVVHVRHHFASVLLTGGVDIRALAGYLGHIDPGFALRTYTHLMPSSTDTMRKAVDLALSGQKVDGLTRTPSALDVP
jgi:integrase